ncbi:ATPase [Spirochaetia bacterium]|nr:ATPase [Spirochaetia bacterium]
MLERTIQSYIERTSRGFPALLVTGPRQVGKTWLLQEIKGTGRKYVSLDDMQARNLARTDPRLFIETYTPPLIIDEVQYAPELFPAIKLYIDSRRKDGLFWLTGSQKYPLMKGIQESLAGRIAIIDLLGFSYKESSGHAHESKPFWPSMSLVKQNAALRKMDIHGLYKIIWQGSFPRLVANKRTDRETFYREYLQTYIERDVKDDIGTNSALRFYDFIRAAAARTGNLLNYASLANDTEINVKTARIWLEALERSGIVKLVEPYSANINTRIVKTPKLYFLDTGLCAYLTKWDSPASLMNGAMNGAILETWVLTEILKSFWHNGKEEAVYFYRDSNQKEIDFILEKNMTLYPVEVKKTAMPAERDIRHFSVLEKQGKKRGTGAVICLYPAYMPITANTISVPAWGI